MKRILIFHGYGETSDSFWLPFIKKEGEKIDYQVVIPELPNTNEPKLDEQLDFVLKRISFSNDDILVGHSSGCPLILTLLENIQITVKKCIFVAGYSSALRVNPKETKNIKDGYGWDKIKANCREFIFINSVNDPWGCDDKQGRVMFDKLGGMLIINNEGHMGSEKYNQPYKEFPFLLKLID